MGIVRKDAVEGVRCGIPNSFCGHDKVIEGVQKNNGVYIGVGTHLPGCHTANGNDAFNGRISP